MSNAATPRIEPAIRARFAPLLRADGFAGSGRTFRRTAGDWIHVVNVQGSRYGGEFAVNLGLQPVAIPDVTGNAPDPKKITEELCAFRRRMSESGKRQDRWWKHEATMESIASAVSEAASVYAVAGRGLLGEATAETSDLNMVTPIAFAAGTYDFRGFGSTECRMAFALSQLRKAQGRIAESIAFAKHALEHVGSAGVFRAQIHSFIAQHGA